MPTGAFVTKLTPGPEVGSKVAGLMYRGDYELQESKW